MILIAAAKVAAKAVLFLRASSYNQDLYNRESILNKKRIYTVKKDTEGVAIDLLSEITGFSNAQLKKLFAAGAVWTQKGKKTQVLRKVKREIKADERLRLYFDPNIKEFDMSEIRCIHDTHHWGIWYKPAGILSQGTKYGDQFTILRHIEKQIGRDPFLIHRLDRETSGLMIFAYTKKAANKLSEQIRNREVRKFYEARIHGQLEGSGEINSPLGGKDALTKYNVKKTENNYTFVEAEIVTGRKHQIRLHMKEVGHPVQGDYRYGPEEATKSKLKLVASKIILKDPFRSEEITFELPDELKLIKY